MKIIFLGTNGWYDTQAGSTVSILVETKSEYIILDAGYGIYKIDKFIRTSKPIYLFLSHYHLDHIIGLHTLNKFNFAQGINVYGPPGLKKVFKTVINFPYSLPFFRLKTKIKLNELKEKMKLPLKAQFKKLNHSSLCYGYRFNLEDKVLTYCTDTGVCNNLLSLSKEADLLILECSFKPGQSNPQWPHLNPESAAKVAAAAGAKRLALTHFDANLYLNFKERTEAEKVSRRIFKNSLASYDNMKIAL